MDMEVSVYFDSAKTKVLRWVPSLLSVDLVSFARACPRGGWSSCTLASNLSPQCACHLSRLYVRDDCCSFHCSFCHPFRQWVEVTGKQHTLRLDDFVLAKTPSVAQFTVERNAGLMDIDCLVTTVPETISTFDCVSVNIRHSFSVFLYGCLGN